MGESESESGLESGLRLYLCGLGLGLHLGGLGLKRCGLGLGLHPGGLGLTVSPGESGEECRSTRQINLNFHVQLCNNGRNKPGGAVKYEVDTGVRPALQQAGAFGESTGSKNEGSLSESMIFGIQWEKNTKICGVIGWEPKVHNSFLNTGL